MAASVSADVYVQTANVVYIARTCQGQYAFLIRRRSRSSFTVAGSVAVLYDHGEYQSCVSSMLSLMVVYSHHVRPRGRPICTCETTRMD
jgi:hypothetical protein